MGTMTRWSGWVGILGLLLLPLSQAAAAAPTIDGQIHGFEIAAQGDGHGAIFVFAFSGTLNGRPTKGSGWIEVFHDPLPTTLGGTAAITGGDGGVLIGWLPLDIDVVVPLPPPDDLLTAVQVDAGVPNVFSVTAKLKIGNRLVGFRTETFAGFLSHVPFPPTIVGTIKP